MTSPEMKDDKVLGEIVRRLATTLHPERIYLFGSQARGDTDPNSDYDLMLIFPQLLIPSFRLIQQARRLLWDLGVAVDILVWPRQAFDERAKLPASFPAVILREGVKIYAA